MKSYAEGMEQHVEPVVCTLTAKAMHNQALEWTDLTGRASSVEKRHDGVVAIYPADLAAQVEDLARREIDCCGSWLSISTERLPDGIRLRATTANPDGLGVLYAMVGAEEQ